MKTRERRWLIVFLLAGSVLVLAASGLPKAKITRKFTPVVDEFPQGRVNWNQGVIKAFGYGAPPARAESPAQAKLMARRAAIVDAYRHLAEIVEGVKVTSQSRVLNLVLQSDEIRTSVEGFIRGAKIVSDKQLPTGEWEIIMQLPLYGEDSLAEIVYPEVFQPKPTVPVKEKPELLTEEAKPIPPPEPKITKPIGPTPSAPKVAIPTEGPFNGLVIDARGFKVERAMSPKIYDTKGREIYGTMRLVDRDFVIKAGIVGYSHSIEEALTKSRADLHPYYKKAVGAPARYNPLYIRAVGASGVFNANVIVSEEDGQRILEENEKTKFLEKCAVIFVIDPKR